MVNGSGVGAGVGIHTKTITDVFAAVVVQSAVAVHIFRRLRFVLDGDRCFRNTVGRSVVEGAVDDVLEAVFTLEFVQPASELGSGSIPRRSEKYRMYPFCET